MGASFFRGSTIVWPRSQSSNPNRFVKLAKVIDQRVEIATSIIRNNPGCGAEERSLEIRSRADRRSIEGHFKHAKHFPSPYVLIGSSVRG